MMHDIRRHITRAVSLLLLAGALAWTLWFVFAGMGNHQDPLYWLYKYQAMEGGRMAVGTLLVGGAIVRLFGAQLWVLRLAGWVCVAVAIALPYVYLQDREQRKSNLHWLALAYMLMNYGAFQEFSPGALTVLLLSVIWVMMMRYRRRGSSMALAIGGGIAIGLAIAVRLPNILVLPIALIAMSVENDLVGRYEFRDRVALIIACIITAVAVYIAGGWLLHPAPVHPAMDNHDIGTIIRALWRQGGLLTGCILMATGMIGIGKLVESRTAKTGLKSRSRWLLGAGLLVGSAVAYYIAYATSAKEWYNIEVTYLISAFCLVLAMTARDKEFYWGIAMLAVASLGTDTGWLKLFPVVLCLLPVAANSMSAGMRRYIWPMAAIMAVAVMLRFSSNSVGRSDLGEADTQATIAPYEHIYLRAHEVAQLTGMREEGARLMNDSSGQKEILAVGQEMHLIRAVTGCRAGVYNEFWSNIYDSLYTAMYRDVISSERPVVICSFSPQFKTRPDYRDGESRMDKMLMDLGYKTIDHSNDKYMLYIPQP